jgi:hypothetical protein
VRGLISLLLVGMAAAAVLPVGCGGDLQTNLEARATLQEITAPFSFEIQTGPLPNPLIRVKVTPAIAGTVHVAAKNEAGWPMVFTAPAAGEPNQGSTRAVGLPIADRESFVRVEIALTDESGVRYTVIRRLRVVQADSGVVVEEVPLMPALPVGPAAAEPLGVTPTLVPAEGAPAGDPGSAGLESSAAGVVTVAGRWGYQAKNGVTFRPLPYARVEVWDSDATGDDLLGRTWTDRHGFFSIDVQNVDESGGADIYVRVLSTDEYSVRVTYPSGELHFGDTTVYEDTQDGTLDVGTWWLTGDDRPAFYIHDLIADDARMYLLTEAGWNNTYNLRVNWPEDIPGSYYDTGSDQIHLQGTDRWDSDVILHEYGHFVMDQNWASFPPFPNCGWHFPGVNTSLGCAWIEGWANYIQAAIQDDPVYSDTEEQKIEIDFENAPLAWDDPRDEGSVTASLWDIHDPANESHDAVFDGINGPDENGIWHAAADTDAADINDFWSSWQTVNDRILSQVSGILCHHGITGACSTPTLTNTPTPTGTPVPTRTDTPVPTPTDTPVPTPTDTPVPTPTDTPVPTPTNTPVTPAATPTLTLTPTPEAPATPTPTATGTPTRTARVPAPGDTDGDGCSDREEESMGFDPAAWWDFYDVPVPANADPTANGPRDRRVTYFDLLAVMRYMGTRDGDGGNPNRNGVAYDSIKGSCDVDADTVPDKEGLCYDRSAGVQPNPPWDAGPPNGVVNVADLLVILAQIPLECSGPP